MLHLSMRVIRLYTEYIGNDYMTLRRSGIAGSTDSKQGCRLEADVDITTIYPLILDEGGKSCGYNGCIAMDILIQNLFLTSAQVSPSLAGSLAPGMVHSLDATNKYYALVSEASEPTVIAKFYRLESDRERGSNRRGV